MANLPTAYAGQRFGRKVLDFYAAAGDVIGADPRARADERRLQDFDGARHTVRVMDGKFALDPGDQASVLRLQPGPSRRSRPVAVVNHSRGGWTRTHPGASALLSRAGVARNMNWALTVMLFAVAALVCVWPYIIAFLAEIAPGAFAGAPRFDVFALAAAALPGLAGFSLAEMSAPLAALLAQVQPGLEGLAAGLAYGAGALTGALLVFAARSWRLLWAPLYVGALGAGAMGFGGAGGALVPALSGLAIAGGVFLAGGAWNRISDAVRLESRIALLADHLLTNAPEETVSASEAAAVAEPEAKEDTSPDTLVDERTAAAVAASLRAFDSDAAQSGDRAEAPGAEAEDIEGVADAEPEHAEASAEATPEGSGGATAGADEPEVAPGADTEEAADEAADSAAGEATRPDTLAASGLDDDEAERLRTDPRYASRAILLPPPPPMPAPGRAPDAGAANGSEPDVSNTGAAAQDRAMEPAGASASSSAPETRARTLNPGRPLPDNVVPIFATTPPSRES